MTDEIVPPKIIYVYVLTDPRYPDDVRYVGVTNNPEKRLKSHIKSIDYRTENNHRLNWIRLLVSEGYHPQMVVIEECDETVWAEREMFWVAYYRSIGCDLVNSNDGGLGSLNPTESTRRKMANANIGKRASEDARRKMSESRSGEKNPNYRKTFSEETRRRMSESWKTRPPMSEETRRKRSESKRGEKNPNYGKTHSEETRKKISENNPNKRPILQYDKFGHFIRQWDSTADAYRELSIDQANINACCFKRGRVKSAGGFIWRFADDPILGIPPTQLKLDLE